MVREDSWICAVLSSFVSKKSGAGLPTCNVPARARTHSVSKGKIRKGTGPGIFAITRANCSGDRLIALYSPTHPTTHSVAITHNITSVRLTALDFVFMQSNPRKKWPDYKGARKEVNNWNVVCAVRYCLNVNITTKDTKSHEGNA